MRPAGFDLRAVIAQPSFTPSVRDGAALLDLLVGHDEVVGEHVRTLYGFDGARCDRVTAAVMCNVLAVARL